MKTRVSLKYFVSVTGLIILLRRMFGARFMSVSGLDSKLYKIMFI